jgi:DNA-directed RNA polymerase delta subunit
MQDLNYYKEIIKDKRKKTNFRDYIKEIASHFPLSFYKNSEVISKFPETDRI